MRLHSPFRGLVPRQHMDNHAGTHLGLEYARASFGYVCCITDCDAAMTGENAASEDDVVEEPRSIETRTRKNVAER